MNPYNTTKHPKRSRFGRLGIPLFAAVLLSFTLADTVHACNCNAMNRRFTQVANQLINAVNAAGANPPQSLVNRINNLKAKLISRMISMESKLKKSPGWKAPAFPMIPPPFGPIINPNPPKGGGRGGGGGGGGGKAGGPPVPQIAWVRNNGPEPCGFQFQIVPLPGNPAGFTPSTLSGVVNVTGQSFATIPFEVAIDPAVPAGTSATFKVLFTDLCSGLPLAEQEFSQITVTAVSDISITPLTPAVFVEPGVPFSVQWLVTNLTNAPITQTFNFAFRGDSSNIEELNDGTTYALQHIFPDDKTANSVTVTLQPAVAPILEPGSTTKLVPGSDFTLEGNSSAIIEWGPLREGEYCTPEMIGCCVCGVGPVSSDIKIFFDTRDPDELHLVGASPQTAGVSAVGAPGSLRAVATWLGAAVPNAAITFEKVTGDFTFNSGNISHDGTETIFSRDTFFDLVGTPSGGTLTVTISNTAGSFASSVATTPGEPLEDIIDRIALDMLNRVATENGFNFVPVVVANSLMVMHPSDRTVSFTSTDPGLTWLIDGTQTETDLNGLLDMTFIPNAPGQAMIKAMIAGTQLAAYFVFDILPPPPPVTVPGDFNGDGFVDSADLALLLSSWGTTVESPMDLSGDGVVNSTDLAIVLSNWGP